MVFILKPPIKLAFGRPPKPHNFNFGDEFSAIIVECITQRSISRSRFDQADLIAVGSILGGTVRKNFRAHGRDDRKTLSVWGSGLMVDHALRRLNYLNYLSVRGPLTRKRTGLEGLPLGDPGLLAQWIKSPAKEKMYSVGIIPHYRDVENQNFLDIEHRIPNSKLLDIRTQAITFLEDVSRCELIVSSSLHGLIFADAYNIPSIWLEDAPIHIGDGFKFYDHFAAVNKFGAEPQHPKSILSLDSALPLASTGDQELIADLQKKLVKTLKEAEI